MRDMSARCPLTAVKSLKYTEKRQKSGQINLRQQHSTVISDNKNESNQLPQAFSGDGVGDGGIQVELRRAENLPLRTTSHLALEPREGRDEGESTITTTIDTMHTHTNITTMHTFTQTRRGVAAS